MKKNEIIELEITDISAEGSGIGHFEGMAVFVPMTAVGDRLSVKIVKVKKSCAFGIIDNIIEPSPDRIDADCGVFRQCGGCVFRHISYESERRIKYKRVWETVKRIGKVDMKPEPIIAPNGHLRYRNKAQFPVCEDGSVGFYAARSHRAVCCDDCLLQPVEFTAAAEVFGEWMRENSVSAYDETQHRGLVRHLYLRKAVATGELMVVVVINGDRLPASERLVQMLTARLGDDIKSIQININKKDTNVILGDKNILIYGNGYITDVLCGVRIRISPLSFYQVNHDTAELLYRKAAEYACPDGKRVLDLYCGAGTIGLSMADRASEIIGVEIVPQAIEDAKINARENGILNTRFICADAADAARMLAEEGLCPDVVIVDPPRKGCTPELLRTIAEDFVPKRLVYVSCDPATLARDIEILSSLGYSLTEYTPVDMFPRTHHVETVALLSRQKAI